MASKKLLRGMGFGMIIGGLLAGIGSYFWYACYSVACMLNPLLTAGVVFFFLLGVGLCVLAEIKEVKEVFGE